MQSKLPKNKSHDDRSSIAFYVVRNAMIPQYASASTAARDGVDVTNCEVAIPAGSNHCCSGDIDNSIALTGGNAPIASCCHDKELLASLVKFGAVSQRFYDLTHGPTFVPTALRMLLDEARFYAEAVEDAEPLRELEEEALFESLESSISSFLRQVAEWTTLEPNGIAELENEE